jgi:hypothetical protein
MIDGKIDTQAVCLLSFVSFLDNRGKTHVSS